MSKGQRIRGQRRQAPPPVGKRQPPDRRLWIGGALLLAAAVAGVAIAATRSGGTKAAKPVDEAALPALQTGPAPWGTAIATLADRLKVLGLPALSQEGSVLHIHQHLDLFVDGKRTPVPGGIGINDNSFISPIHTHDASGVIHVESPSKEQFTLGQFFAIWGVRFTPHALGGYRSRANRPIRFYLDGKRYAADPTRLALASHQEIAVVIGKPPSRIPASYAFPAGE